MKSNSFATLVTTIALIIYSGSLFGQTTIKVKKFSEKLPEIQLVEKTPQKYLMVVDYLDYDIYGNFIKKQRVSGEYTRGLKNNFVKWNNVRIAHSQKRNESFSKGEKQNYMENFAYVAVTSAEMLNESFFKDIPEADVSMKTLVWDMSMFEQFAWNFWDTLQLNREYSAEEINFIVQIEGLGTFKNQDIKITWTGITKKNDKLCAIIKYNAMNNPLDFNINNIQMKGRSNYWGNIYVSLTDKQIEYGELYEDVVMDIKMNEQETGNTANTTRFITLEKIR